MFYAFFSFFHNSDTYDTEYTDYLPVSGHLHTDNSEDHTYTSEGFLYIRMQNFLKTAVLKIAYILTFLKIVQTLPFLKTYHILTILVTVHVLTFRKAVHGSVYILMHKVLLVSTMNSKL